MEMRYYAQCSCGAHITIQCDRMPNDDSESSKITCTVDRFDFPNPTTDYLSPSNEMKVTCPYCQSELIVNSNQLN